MAQHQIVKFINKPKRKHSMKKNIYLFLKVFAEIKKPTIFALASSENNSAKGEMAERSNAAVLKTVDCNRSGGSNPSFSAKGREDTQAANEDGL